MKKTRHDMGEESITEIFEGLKHPRIITAKQNSPETLAAVEAIDNLEKEIDIKIRKEYPGLNRGLGFCHFYWSVKKNILKNKYGIIWYSPQDEMPFVLFD